MAASAPISSSAVMATSAARSGVRQSSMNETFSRTARYSRIYLPAWRMSQMGVLALGSPRQARMKEESAYARRALGLMD